MELEPTVLWITGDGGDGKSTLIKQLDFKDSVSTDLYIVHQLDRLAGVLAHISDLWYYDADIVDETGDRKGNLQIGGFWNNITSRPDLSHFILDDFVDFHQWGQLTVLEGWLPDRLSVMLLDKLKNRGVRVWVAQKVTSGRY